MVDLEAQARTLAHIHDAYLGGLDGGPRPRSIVLESWQRSQTVGVDPDRHSPPVVLDSPDVAQLSAAHPLMRITPLLRATLVSAATEGQYVVVVTDRDGVVLWVEGDHGVRGVAEHEGLLAGAQWSEEAAGTNAMGTALATGRPVQIHSAEHLVRRYHRWSCAAAPIHDPSTGAVLGAVDITGPLEAIHPGTMGLVAATARLSETELRHQADVEPRRPAMAAAIGSAVGRSQACQPRLELVFLRGRQPLAVLNGRRLALSLRHAELVAVLALHPDGLTAEQLAMHVYDDRSNPVTVRAEMHRLRRALGTCLSAKPYRLVAEVDADFLTVRRLAGTGDLASVLRLYHRPLLAESEAPAVRIEREMLSGLARRAAEAVDDIGALLHWLRTEEGIDHLEGHLHLLNLLPVHDRRRLAVSARVARLRQLDELEWRSAARLAR